MIEIFWWTKTFFLSWCLLSLIYMIVFLFNPEFAMEAPRLLSVFALFTAFAMMWWVLIVHYMVPIWRDVSGKQR